MSRILSSKDFVVSDLIQGYDYLYLVFNRGFI